ncbi:MAG: hypothetical protein KDE08_13510 [Rhodobacteraceae bacterium]|nr:hypothetical protein [Paracoccaceae bacterium]
MSKPAVLEHSERVRINPDRLAALCAELGEAGAELVVLRSIEDISARLLDVQRLAQVSNTAAIIATASCLAEIADDIGMSSLARVAGDVARSGRAGDGTALSATIARLLRIGDRSLMTVWDLQDITV